MMALIVKPTIAQEAITVKPTPLCDGFEIKFKMPEYTVVDTNILEVYGIDRTYSLINVNHKDFHNFAYKAGTSTLSAFTIALPIPENIEDFSVESSINMKEFATNLSANDFITLPHALLPIQEEVIDNDDSAAIQFIVRQDSFPSSDGLVYFEPFVDEAFYIMGQSGVYLTFCPFVYNTNFQSLATIDSITITFTYITSSIDSKGNLESLFVIENENDSIVCLNESVRNCNEDFVNDIFDYVTIIGKHEQKSNFGAKSTSINKSLDDVFNKKKYSNISLMEDYISIIENTDKKTNSTLLIVSAPLFINEIKPYVNYKRYQGYNVGLVKVSSSITSTELSAFLRDDLRNANALPDYVLLVGGTIIALNDSSFIAFHGDPEGDKLNVNNPANDYLYSKRREGTGLFDNWHGQYFHIGRFNVSSQNQLKNVIYHTMCSEQNYLLNKRRILKITSRGKHMCWAGGALESIEFHGVEEHHLNQDHSKEHFEEQIHADTPWWLILYNGHGGYTETSPYTWECETKAQEYCRLIEDENNHDDIWADHNSYDESYPIMFFQACATGAYGGSNYFGAKATRFCASAFIGSSTDTGAEWGRVLLNKAFDHGNKAAWKTKEHIGEFLNKTKENAFKYKGKELQLFKKSSRWHGVERFNLFGDPSMIINGHTINNLTFVDEYINNNKIFYKVLDTIDTNNSSIIVDGANSELILIAGEKISLKPGFKVLNDATFKANIESINKIY